MRGEVLTGVERRRRWSTEEKLRIVGEADAAGASVSEVARRHDISRQHVYQWRRELRACGLRRSAPAVFLPVELAGDAPASDGAAEPAATSGQRIEIGLRNGRTLRVAADLPEAVLARLIRIAETA